MCLKVLKELLRIKELIFEQNKYNLVLICAFKILCEIKKNICILKNLVIIKYYFDKLPNIVIN